MEDGQHMPMIAMLSAGERPAVNGLALNASDTAPSSKRTPEPRVHGGSFFVKTQQPDASRQAPTKQPIRMPEAGDTSQRKRQSCHPSSSLLLGGREAAQQLFLCCLDGCAHVLYVLLPPRMATTSSWCCLCCAPGARGP